MTGSSRINTDGFMSKSDVLYMRIDPELKERLRVEALGRGITLSMLVSLVMAQWDAQNRTERQNLTI